MVATPVGNTPVALLQPRIAYLLGRTTGAGVDHTDIERGIKDLYDMHRRETLEAHYWSFAQKQTILGSSPTESPPWGYGHYAPLPDDFVKLSFLNFNGANRLGVLGKHEIHGRLLASDYERVYMLYTRNIIETDNFSAMFLKAVAYSLTQELSLSLAGDKDLGDRLRSLAAEIRYDAQEWDYSNQGTMESIEGEDVLASRLGGLNAGTGEVPGVSVTETPIPGLVTPTPPATTGGGSGTP